MKRAGAAHRLARMPMAAIPAFGGIAAGGISTGRGGMRGSVVDAAPQRPGGNDQPTYPGRIPYGGIFTASRKPVGRLSALDEEQAGAGAGSPAHPISCRPP